MCDDEIDVTFIMVMSKTVSLFDEMDHKSFHQYDNPQASSGASVDVIGDKKHTAVDLPGGLT